MSVNIRVIAYTVPAICMVLGFLLIVAGDDAGWALIIMGFILQILWLFTKRR